MQNKKTQKSLVSKFLVLFAAVALMFVGVHAFAENELDLSSLNYGEGYNALELKPTDADNVEKVINQLKVQNPKLDERITKDSVKVAFASATKEVTMTPSASSTVVKGQKIFTLVDAFNISQISLAADKKLVLAPKDGKIDSEDGLKALRAAGVKIPATVTKELLTFVVGKDDKATKVSIKAVEGQESIVIGEKELDFTVSTTFWYKQTWLLILVIVVFVAAVAGGVFLFVKKTKNK
jgi:hypothetical protein